MMTDTSRTLKIESSPAKLFGYVAAALLMTTGAIFVSFFPEPISFRKLVGGYFGTVFFGLATCVWVWRLLNSPRPVITISPEGIRDTRVTSAPIPWSAVTRISTWPSRGPGWSRYIVFAIKPSVDAGLSLTPIARWNRAVNGALGADGLCITAAGLKIGFNTLLQICQDYARQARDGQVRHRPAVPNRHWDYT